jgi:membrane-associated phospholipid phosphatase
MVLMTAVLTLALSGPAQPAQASPSDPQPQQAPREQQAEPREKKAEPQDQKADAKEPPTPAHTGIRALFGDLGEDLKHLPEMQNVYIAAIGGGLALAAHPGDQAFNAKLLSHYDAVNTAFAPGKYIGNTPEQVAFSVGTYVFGRLRDQPKVAHLGMDLLQAQILSEILVEPLKYTVRRERPDGSNRLSFPSGHASVTFATATVIERHLGWRKSLLGYAIASYVAMSRIHDNQHYLSDVIFGAAVGSIAGRTVVHHKADYWAFTPVAMPGGGVALMVSRTRWER